MYPFLFKNWSSISPQCFPRSCERQRDTSATWQSSGPRAKTSRMSGPRMSSSSGVVMYARRSISGQHISRSKIPLALPATLVFVFSLSMSLSFSSAPARAKRPSSSSSSCSSISIPPPPARSFCLCSSHRMRTALSRGCTIFLPASSFRKNLGRLPSGRARLRSCSPCLAPSWQPRILLSSAVSRSTGTRLGVFFARLPFMYRMKWYRIRRQASSMSG
mmetsp:Transcript_9945/g.24609  ORF Transcript_9945/g.24609 Transcript_9945/m.24609 type:complete len:218 (+) Transcript_9945:1327-1980(+)